LKKIGVFCQSQSFRRHFCESSAGMFFWLLLHLCAGKGKLREEFYEWLRRSFPNAQIAKIDNFVLNAVRIVIERHRGQKLLAHPYLVDFLNDRIIKFLPNGVRPANFISVVVRHNIS
jgi:hypothetical protein